MSAARSSVPLRMVDSAHFYTQRDEAGRIFQGRRQWLMEHFYRTLRQRHGVLMTTDGKPEGGQWNFDHDNRKPWRGDPPEPADRRRRHDHRHRQQPRADEQREFRLDAHAVHEAPPGSERSCGCTTPVAQSPSAGMRTTVPGSPAANFSMAKATHALPSMGAGELLVMRPIGSPAAASPAA